MTRISADWLECAEAQAVFSMLTEAGYQAYAVGGCVRNELLGAPVADVDLASDARPETVMNLAEQAGLHPVPTGIEHGTITVVSGGIGYEVTTFRKDVETDGRRAVIAFADAVEQDAHRRDFTMNALYATAEGVLLDPLGGLDDLVKRRVRFIDDAGDRIREDYLRILRFFRFHAWFGDPGGGIDPDALAACAELAEGVDTLSKERVGTEICKLLAAPDPAPSVAVMAQAGILARILPGAIANNLAPLIHLEGLAKTAPNWVRRLAALGGQNVKDNLRMSRADHRRFSLYRDHIAPQTGLSEIAYRHNAGSAVDVALLRATLLDMPLEPDLHTSLTNASQQVFPVRAADLSLKGAALGACLKSLEQSWIESGFRLTKAELLA